jgi:hypothetical protein
MIDCAHYRVQELPRDLTNSLDNYPKAMILQPQQQSSSPDTNNSATTTVTKKSIPVEALFLSTNAVAVQIDVASPPRRASLSSRFQVSPVVDINAPPSWRKASDPSSTKVIQPLHVDALNVTPIKTSMIYSPSDSIDSGVISPGIVSSDEDRLRRLQDTTTDTPRPPKLRERSASECFPDQNIPNYPGLKGILKKPKTSLISTVSNGLRRSHASQRQLFSRSISECHDNSSSHESGMEFDFLAESNDTLAESNASSPPRGIGGFFRVDEEEGESDSDEQVIAAAEIQSRKKRVSFSEHVQARIYRTGSSIIGQKKKNERRNRCRNRNRSSGSTDSDGTLNETDDDESSSFSISPAERSNLEKLAKEYAERCESSSSPLMRSERNISTDSAYDDDIDESEKRMEMLTVA